MVFIRTIDFSSFREIGFINRSLCKFVAAGDRMIRVQAVEKNFIY